MKITSAEFTSKANPARALLANISTLVFDSSADCRLFLHHLFPLYFFPGGEGALSLPAGLEEALASPALASLLTAPGVREALAQQLQQQQQQQHVGGSSEPRQGMTINIQNTEFRPEKD